MVKPNPLGPRTTATTLYCGGPLRNATGVVAEIQKKSKFIIV